MRIWFDVLTPKQVVFFEPMVGRLRKRHEVLCTSRRYREAEALARLRGMDLERVGRHGGAGAGSKLDAGLSRARSLAGRVARFGPDAAVSLCSPEASRVAFGLGVRHVAFSDAPHAEAVMRLRVQGPCHHRSFWPRPLDPRAGLPQGLCKLELHSGLGRAGRHCQPKAVGTRACV